MIPRLTNTPAPLPLYAAFLAELRTRGFAGDLSLTHADRTVLATDNSIYQLTPQAIAFPRDADDLVRIARAAQDPRFADVKLAPRGGGTGTNGQSLTDGLVVDVSRHMNRILEINVAERWARVEAGVVKDQLNAALAEHGLFFAPELSTSNRATIGGMISTDACGQGSCLYGKTRNHVLELTTVLLDGTVWRSKPLTDEELAAVERRPDRVGADPPAPRGRRTRPGGPDRPALPEAQPQPDRLRPRPHPRRERPLRPQRDPLRLRGHARASWPRPSSTCCRSRATPRWSTCATTASTPRCATPRP